MVGEGVSGRGGGRSGFPPAVPEAELSIDHIFVLTPLGDVIELPEGATPLDFAFQLHTELGIAFRAARVNGSIVPLHHQLDNGDIVEIIRHRDPRPSPRWITMLKTASARSRLRKYLGSQDKPRYVLRGRRMLNAELERKNVPPLDPDLAILRRFAGKVITHAEREDLLAKIGQGSVKVSSVLPHLDAFKSAFLQQRKRAANTKVVPPPAERTPVVEGVPMPVRYAKCCKPDLDKGCPLKGVIGRTGEVRVHRATCKLLVKANRERFVAVRWSEGKQ